MPDAFVPKLVTVLREGYGTAALRADAIAGLTVAIVALPLSMAIAIASGGTPGQGLVTAIVGGFLVSALGGSRHQIGGPAGAFIVLVSVAVATHGMAGTVLATFLAGLILLAAGWLRLGTFVRFIPFPVTVGFTAGIAVIIFASQLRDLLGLRVAHEPGPLLQKLPVLWAALPTLTPAAVGLAAGTVAVILGLRRWRPHWPGMLIAVALAALAATALPVETIGTRFGAMPAGLPLPALPDLSLPRIVEVLPTALGFALLGAIESLLSAVVADGMSGRRHRSNAELVAQGVANIGSALFGGLPVTGTIARTATNVRAGAHGPVSGMLHALFLLAFMLVAAPLLSLIPLAALAGVLAVVAWNMVERPAIAALLRAGPGETAVLAVTFLLTVFRDLTEAIVVGFALGAILFIHRMGRAAEVRAETAGEDPRAPDPDVVVYRISGAFFFGAAASIGTVLDRISDTHRAMVLDLTAVPFLDSTGANVIEGLARKTARRDVRMYLAGANAEVAQALSAHGIHGIRSLRTVEDALADWRNTVPGGATQPGPVRHMA